MLWDIVGFILCVFVLVQAAEFAVRHISSISRHYRISEFVGSFIIVGFVATFPEFFVLVTSSIKGIPSLGLGAVLGNNVVDLTFVLGLVVLAGGTLIIRTKTIEHDLAYMLLVTLPALVGLDGTISRIDGLVLLAAGGYYLSQLVRDARVFHKVFKNGKNGGHLVRHVAWFVVCMAIVMGAAQGVVWFAEELARGLGIPAFLFGSVVIALGAALPEMTFALRAMFRKNPGVALGDLLGNVVLDATIVIGLVAVVAPITIAVDQIAVIGLATLIAVMTALFLLRSGDRLTRLEGLSLVLLYVAFVIVQLLSGTAA